MAVGLPMRILSGALSRKPPLRSIITDAVDKKGKEIEPINGEKDDFTNDVFRSLDEDQWPEFII